MKKVVNISLILISILTISCKPEIYTGPLDSPIGNWEGVRSEYFFNGEAIADIDTSCVIGGISFYKQGLCCIEGQKGAIPYTYNHEAKELIIDNSYWAVHLLTGAEFIMEYIETIFPEEDESIEEVTKTDSSQDSGTSEEDMPEVVPDKNGVILPAEFNGMAIYSDDNGYYYENDEYSRTYCNFYGQKDETGTLVIDFWYDVHIDHFIPLVIETDKK